MQIDKKAQYIVDTFGRDKLVGMKFIGTDVDGIEREAICIGFNENTCIVNFQDENGKPYNMKSDVRLK